MADVDRRAGGGRAHMGRPSVVVGFRKVIEEALRAQPDIKGVELLRRARLAGYTGGKSALYVLVRELRPRKAVPLVRFEGLAGEFSQHDFGEVEVTFLDGTEQRVQFFASRLKYSRHALVEIVPDQRAESLVRALVDHFATWGGIPLLAVFDRPKTVALRWDSAGRVTEWNPIFAGMALDLGLGVELCWPYQPQQKGAVENLVGWVKGSFFKQRRFADMDDLRAQLGEWLEEINTRRPSRATGTVPAERLREELPRLRPLKVQPDEFALRIPVVVDPTGMVVHEGHAYSMDPQAIGLSGTLFLHRRLVRVIAGRFQSLHERKFAPGEGSVLPQHRAAAVAAVSGERGRRYLMRQHLMELGPPALEYLTELVHRRPRIWVSDVERLHALLQSHGPKALRDAFADALRERAFGAEYVEHLLAPVLPIRSPA